MCIVSVGGNDVCGNVLCREAIRICPEGTYCSDGVSTIAAIHTFSQSCHCCHLLAYLIVRYHYVTTIANIFVSVCNSLPNDCIVCWWHVWRTQVLRECPAGRYGNSEELSTADCSGPCRKGYYCPIGSTSSIQVRAMCEYCGVLRVGWLIDRDSIGNAMIFPYVSSTYKLYISSLCKCLLHATCINLCVLMCCSISGALSQRQIRRQRGPHQFPVLRPLSEPQRLRAWVSAWPRCCW